MRNTIYFLAFIMITLCGCSSDDNNTEDPQSECDQPSNLSANNITASSAVLAWSTSSSTGNLPDFFQVEYGLNGFNQGTGTVVNSNDGSVEIQGLSSNTAYDYYVRANCGASNFSDWNLNSFVTD